MYKAIWSAGIIIYGSSITLFLVAWLAANPPGWVEDAATSRVIPVLVMSWAVAVALWRRRTRQRRDGDRRA